ncbi:hypothetical protein M0805_009228 [Coniferiporia weirii]|nr:hypothetical protein M0805_009228 [Coniferiporia weirii]
MLLSPESFRSKRSLQGRTSPLPHRPLTPARLGSVHPDSASSLGPPLEALTIFETLAEHAHLDLTGKILQESKHPRGLGGFCDVFRGLSLAHGITVAIKRFRVHIHQDRSFVKSLARELHIWSKLHHPNVLPLLGYLIDDGVYPALISRWMTNGTSLQYLKNNPDADVLNMVKGIAAGLCYLHAMRVIHSDLKSDNVLISTTGIPLLADFGVSRILIESETIDTKSTLRGSVRWMAIELFDSSLPRDFEAKKNRRIPERSKQVHTEQADVWAFGMTVYELLTMLRPYHLLPNDFQVMFAIIQGQLPSLPEYFITGTATPTELALWDLCRKCWHKNPSLRPTMVEVNHELSQKVSAIKTNQPGLCHLPTPPYSKNESFPSIPGRGLPDPPKDRRTAVVIPERFSSTSQERDICVRQFVKRRPEDYAWQSPGSSFKAGLSARARSLRIVVEQKVFSSDQRSSVLGLLHWTVSDYGERVSRKSTPSKASLVSVGVFVASDPSGLLTGATASLEESALASPARACAVPGVVTRRFSCPASRSWTLVSSTPESEITFASSQPSSPDGATEEDTNTRLCRALDKFAPLMKIRDSGRI